MTSYQYTGTAHWTKSGGATAEAEGIDHPIAFSSPPEFQGQSGMWTPEHFLVAAVTGCFITTFVAIAKLSKFEALSLDVSATGSLEKVQHGFQFTRVTIRPVLTIAQDSDRERALRLIEKTEHSCLVARSLRSEMTVEPRILVEAAVAA
jgi:peroxiredoxin-like protein